MLYHCDELSLQGGFFGVDVFFTISGFLIFSSLLNRIDSGKGLELGEYFLKRFRRIYPALFALIPISVTLAWLVNRDMLVGIRNQIMTVLLGCYNWYAISSGASYFSQMNPDIFRHLWFMSLLMQFYLIAPFVVLLLRKIIIRWAPVCILTALAGASAVSMGLLYHSGADPTRVYFGTDTHAMGLWLGAALAWILPILRHEHGRANESRIMERFHKIWIQFGDSCLWLIAGIAVDDAAYHSRPGGVPWRYLRRLRACCDADRRNHTIRILDAGSACVQAACRFGPLFVWHLSVALAIMAAAEIPAAPVGRMACRQAAVLHLHPHRAVRVRILATVREASRSCGIHRVDSSDQWRRSRALRPSDIHGRGAGMLMELLRIRCGDGIGTNQCGAILGYQRQAVAATQSCRFGTTPNTDAKEATA